MYIYIYIDKYFIYIFGSRHILILLWFLREMEKDNLREKE